MRIISVDPGSIRAGFAILEGDSAQSLHHVSSGTIQMDSTESMAKRLFCLQSDLEELFLKYQPQSLAIETTFFAKNAQSALKLGQARGVVLATAAKNNCEIYEYSPTQVKSSICGSGRADKEQIEHMIRLILKLPKTFKFVSSDHSDALAICLTHVQTMSSKAYDCTAQGKITSKNTDTIRH